MDTAPTSDNNTVLSAPSAVVIGCDAEKVVVVAKSYDQTSFLTNGVE